MNQARYDFFISYNRSDLPYAKRISALIKGSGLRCWCQFDDSKQEYAMEIRDAVRSSAAFLVLLSENSAQSEWVGKEILEAIRVYSSGKLKILPIMVEDLNSENYNYFHHILGDFNWLSLKDYSSDKELLRAIAKQVSIHIIQNRVNSIYSAEAENELERLRKQNELYHRYAVESLNEIFQKNPNPSVLDVGSSDGANIQLRLEGKSFSHLLCIDKDKEKLLDAEERFRGDLRVNVLETDITAKSFSAVLIEYLQKNNMPGFDFIHISAVLLHLKNPKSVLKVLHEALNENGVIFIQDEDDGFSIAYEDNAEDLTFFSDCFYIWEHSKESGDRHMGRKIPIFLREAGFHEIQMRSSCISSVDFGGTYMEELWDIYFNPKYWVVDSPEYFDKRDAFEKCAGYIKRHDKMKQKYMKGNVFLSLGVPIFVATK